MATTNDNPSCPTAEELKRYVARDMSDDQRASVQRHLDACAACRKQAERIDAERDAMLDELRNAHQSISGDTRPPTGPTVDAAEHPQAGVAPAPRVGAPPDGITIPGYEVSGRYRLLERLGEGGMGVVFLAEQSEPVRRRVALKIIKLGMDTKEVVARFEAERQALALMNHPNVAKVFDAGATEQGRPYFVMEHVPGVSITEYCDRERLTTQQRLELFQQVCHAVQHAHQKGIIHRDIKPSNVLVMMQDGQPVPKVIDFGVAKATNLRLTEQTVFTEQGRLIGTPEYMSPEQAEMTAVDIDTRTDIYSLGVLLYELLVGSRPFESENLREAGYAAIQKIIRETEPEKPSTRLSSLGEKAGTISQQRRTDLRTLRRQLHGDLDWIVMKCLEKDRTRRYDTANALALELGRHLNNEPVLAGPPSAGYRLRKFVRRNRAAVAAAGVIAAVLIAATAVSIGFALSEAEQRRNAEAEKTRADHEKAIAQAVNDFLTEDLLAAVAPSPESGKGKDVLMRDVLDEAAERIEEASGVGGRFEEMPLVEASIRATLGTTYYLLGVYGAAEPHLERARLLRRRELSEEHHDTLASMVHLALLYDAQGRYDEAEPLRVKTLEIKKRVLGEVHPDTLSSMGSLAARYAAQGRYDQAERLFVKTLESTKRVLGEEHPETLRTIHNIANLYSSQGRYDEAEQLYVKTLEIGKGVLGEEHPNTLRTTSSLAMVYLSQGRYDEAEPLFVKTLEIQKRVLGEEHPTTLNSMVCLAALNFRQGRYDEAEPLYVKALEIAERIMGEEHPRPLAAMHDLAILYKDQGRYAEAEPLSVKSLEIAERIMGEEHPSTLASMSSLANLYKAQGRYAEAEPLFVKTLEIQKRVLGEEHPSTLFSMHNLALLYFDQGRHDEAERRSVKTLKIKKRVLGEEHPSTLNSMHNLALLYDAQGRYDEAEPLSVKTLEIKKRVLGEEHPSTLASITDLGNLYLLMKRFDDARAMFERSPPIKRRVLGIRHPWTRSALMGLAQAYDGLDRGDDALPLWRERQEFQLAQVENPDAAALVLNDTAWDLLTNEHAELRNATRALPLARRAVGKSGGVDPNFLDTLALAQHLTGDTPAAIETEKKALSLLPPGAPRGDYEAALARFEAALKNAGTTEEPGGG